MNSSEAENEDPIVQISHTEPFHFEDHTDQNPDDLEVLGQNEIASEIITNPEEENSGLFLPPENVFENDSFFSDDLNHSKALEFSKSDLENFEMSADKGFEDGFAEKLKTDSYFSSTEDMSADYFVPVDVESNWDKIVLNEQDKGKISDTSSSLDDNFDELASRPQPEKSMAVDEEVLSDKIVNMSLEELRDEEALSDKTINMSFEELRLSPLAVDREQEMFHDVKRREVKVFQRINHATSLHLEKADDQEFEPVQGKKKKQSLFKRGKKLFSFGRKRNTKGLNPDEGSGIPQSGMKTSAKSHKKRKQIDRTGGIGQENEGLSPDSSLSNTYRRYSKEDVDPVIFRTHHESVRPSSFSEDPLAYGELSNAASVENISNQLSTSKSEKKRRSFSFGNMLPRPKTKSVSMPNINEDSQPSSAKRKMKFSFKHFSTKSVYVVNPTDSSKSENQNLLK